MKTILMASAFFALAIGVQGAIVTDNFDSYTNGPVVGQSGWFNRANGLPYVIQDTLVEEGAKALYTNSNTESVITKTGDAVLSDGRQSFYVWAENRVGWGQYNIGENVQIGVFQTSWDGPARAMFAFMRDGHTAYINESVGTYVNFDTFIDNSWNLAEIEWRAVDATARYRVNSGTWTDWLPFHGSSAFTGFNTLGIVTFSLGSGGAYFDSLGDSVPEPATLGLLCLGFLALIRKQRW